MRHFGDFDFDPVTQELWLNGKPLTLQTQPARLLDLLTCSSGELLTRQQLRQELWDEQTHVDFERCINFYIKQIRRALGDDARSPRFVETLPRRGYRFLMKVDVSEPSGSHMETRSTAEGKGRRPLLPLLAAGLAGLLVGGAVGHDFAGSPADQSVASAFHVALGIDGEDCPLGRFSR